MYLGSLFFQKRATFSKMINIETHLKIIATEAIESGGMSEEQWKREGCPLPEFPSKKKSAPIDYKLELIQEEDGTIYWVE